MVPLAQSTLRKLAGRPSRIPTVWWAPVEDGRVGEPQKTSFVDLRSFTNACELMGYATTIKWDTPPTPHVGAWQVTLARPDTDETTVMLIWTQ